MNCSDPSDVNIYGFNRAKCVAQAATACTLADRDMLTRISRCDLQINPCVTTSDRTAAVGAINGCVGMGTSLSPGCIGAIQ